MAKNFQKILLPSKCLAYDGIDRNGIQISQLTGEEERILSETNVSNFDKKILEVFQNIIQGVEPHRLTLGDRMYILIWEIMNSFSDDLPVTYICLDCEHKVSVTGKLSTMEVLELPDTFKQPVDKILPCGKRVKLRLLTSGDEAAVVDYENKGGDGWSYRYASTIVSGDDIFKRMEFYKSLSMKDTASVRAFQDEYSHGPDMQIKAKCPECGKEELVSIPFRLEFLFPTGPELIRNYGSGVPTDVVAENIKI